MWRQTISHAIKLKLGLSICFIACVGAAAVGARHLLSLSAAEGVTAVPLAQEDEGTENQNKVILITLRPQGFEPAAIRLPAGDYLFVFNNRTGLDQFALRLDRENHGTVREARPPRLKRDWRQFLRVTPGTYVVREMNHPEWTLRMTVTQ